MNRKVVIAVIVSLITGCGVGYMVLTPIISKLQSEILTLQMSYQNLNSTYNNLLKENQQLQTWLNGNLSLLQKTLADQDYYIETIEKLSARLHELEGMLNYQVYVLTDQGYYYSVKDSLQNANESIIVVMYSMIYDPDDPDDWANDLIRELVNAKNRGVNITVIIEYRTYFGYMDDNLEAYNYLLSNGVNVRLDNETDTDHLKLVIIDNHIVYVGSHNWSESALYYNHETSVKIVSSEIAQMFRQHVETSYGL